MITSHQTFVTVMLVLGASACTRADVDDGNDRIHEGSSRLALGAKRVAREMRAEAQQLESKIPPANELKADLKEAGHKLAYVARKVGDNVVRETKATRDLVRERSER
jgi:hypothetical protein